MNMFIRGKLRYVENLFLVKPLKKYDMIGVETEEEKRALDTPPETNAPPSFIEKYRKLSNVVMVPATDFLYIME